MARTNQDSLRMISGLMAWAVVLLALYFAKDLILPFVLACLFSFILAPVVSVLEHWRLNRIASVLLTAMIAMCLLGTIGWLVSRQVTELSRQLPNYKHNLVAKIRAVRGAADSAFHEATVALRDVSEQLSTNETPLDSGDSSAALHRSVAAPADQQASPIITIAPSGMPPGHNGSSLRSIEDASVNIAVVPAPTPPWQQIQTWLGSFITPVTTSGLVFIVTVFMLLQREDLRDRVLTIVGTTHLRATTEAVTDATSRVGKLIRMQTLINVVYGAGVGVGLYLIGLPNALLWATLAMILRFVPYVGPWIVATIPIILAISIFDGWTTAALTISLFVILELVVNNVLEPWLYGASTGLSSMGIVVAAIFWTWLWGPIGLVIAMPITVCLVVAGNYVPQLRFLTILLGTDTALSPSERFYQRLLSLDDNECGRICTDYLRNHTYTELFDDIVFPAIAMSERDRMSGVLNESQQAMIGDTVKDLIDDAQAYAGSATSENGDSNNEHKSSGVVLIMPAHDAAAELTSRMLTQALQGSGFALDEISRATLVSESLDRIQQIPNLRAVVVTAISPSGTRQSRYLCKKISQRFPQLPLIVHFVTPTGDATDYSHLQRVGATAIAHSLHATVQNVESQPRPISAAKLPMP